jgi:uncharacterized protein
MMSPRLGGTLSEAPPVWNPLPFRQFILKVTSRCDLACDYCYMFEMADASWRDQPKRMSVETAAMTAQRISEHAAAHELPGVQVIFHGGEPLLAGPEYIGNIAETIRESVGVPVDFRVQTNGTLLTDSMIDVLSRHNIGVGVSMDGGLEANDRHRRYADGRGSYAVVANSLRRLRDQAPQLFTGILCTVDLRNDPIGTYEALEQFRPPVVDFLLPHGNWMMPPPGRNPLTDDTPYGVWLSQVFDHWYAAKPPTSRVRMFTEIIHLMLGGNSAVETVGLGPAQLIVINTDGALEQVDTLRSAYSQAADTGFNVHTHAFDAAITHPAIVARQRGADGLAATCKDCALHTVCGGGLYAHRYRADTGFLNPSVYCPDLAYVIRHIHRRLSGEVARLTAKNSGSS